MAADTACSRCGLKATASTADSSRDVLNMLRSGHVPSSATTPCIPERVATLESRRQQLNSDIVRLEALILQMREEVVSTDVDIARTKSLAAPIRSIPREILIHIFALAREPSENSLWMGCAPNNLGHVCKFWRTLSRSVPSLWANVDLSFAEYSVNSYAVDLLQQQLVLSNPCTLNIRMFLDGMEYSIPSGVQTMLMNVLAVHAPRWRSHQENHFGIWLT
ncbi:hypothetical protein BDZ89DRAFT_1148444 [Hymenopellis radicata]|nr:hypothetical protein BDZ89DRAFT_1148444 [Hymenopellis radicata]